MTIRGPIVRGLLALAVSAAALSVLGPSNLASAADETDAITAVLRHWLSLVDRQQYGDSWGEAGGMFKTMITERDWAARVRPVRQPLGAVVKRVPFDQKYATTLPGLPDGDYDIVRFHTAFEHKQAAVETVVLRKEEGGWKVNGYFVK